MSWFLLISLSLIFMFTPFLKGLYFDIDLYGIHLLIQGMFLVFITYLTIKKKIHEIYKVLPVILLVVPNLFSLLFAESPYGAWNETMRWFTYLSFFIMLYWVFLDPILKKLGVIVFYLTGIGLSLITVFGQYGWIHYEDLILNNRFAGVFQYPNTFAIVMGIYYLFGLSILTRTKIATRIIFYALPMVPFMLGLLLSGSRGSWLVFLLVWLVGLFFLTFNKQLIYIFLTLMSILFTLFVSGFFSLLLSMILFVGCAIVFAKASQRIVYKRNLFLPVTALFLLLLSVLDFRYKGLFYRLLPSTVQERVSQFRFFEGTAQERIIIFKDALTASKDAPLFGFGGDAWTILFSRYQSLPYNAREIHNGYLEWLVNYGWIGFLLYLVVFVYLFTLVIQKYRINKSNKQFGIIQGLLLVFIHSLIDFDFSFGTVWFIVFWLFALGIISLESGDLINIKGINPAYFYNIMIGLFSIFVLFMFVYSYRFSTAERLLTGSLKEEMSASRKQITLEKAMKYNPYQPQIYNQLAKVYLSEYLVTKQEIYRERSLNLTKEAALLEPKNSLLLINLAQIDQKIGQLIEANRLLSLAQQSDHFNTQLYEDSIRLNTILAINNYVIQKRTGQAYAQEAITVLNKNRLAVSEFKGRVPLLEQEQFNGRKFEVSDRAKYYAAISYLILQDEEKVLSITEELIDSKDVKVLEMSQALRIYTLEKVGNAKEANELRSKFNGTRESLEEALMEIGDTFK